MNKWQETVKRVAKQHPGKSLREILPIAKMEYKKMRHVTTKSTKKVKKHHSTSRVRKSTRLRKSRKGHKGRKGSRYMRGGSDCATGGSCSSGTCGTPSVGGSSHMLVADTTTAGSESGGSGPGAYNSGDFSWEGEHSLVGGSHCSSGHMKSHKKRGRGRRSKGRRMRGGGSCPHDE